MWLLNRLGGLKEVLQFDNAVQLLVSRLFFRPEVEIYRYRGLNVLVDHAGGDAPGTRGVLASEMYRRFLPDLARLQRLPGLNVLDFGANGGGFLLLLKAHNYPLQRTVSVEMNPSTYQRLCFNISTNIGTDVATCLNVALAGKRGAVRAYLGRGSTSDSISKGIDAVPVEGKKSCDITLATFDDIVSTYLPGEDIDICKVDIEGAEYEALLDAKPSLISRVRFLVMEIHEMRGRDPAKLVEWLADAGLFRIAGDPGILGVHLFCRNDVGLSNSRTADDLATASRFS